MDGEIPKPTIDRQPARNHHGWDPRFKRAIKRAMTGGVVATLGFLNAACSPQPTISDYFLDSPPTLSAQEQAIQATAMATIHNPEAKQEALDRLHPNVVNSAVEIEFEGNKPSGGSAVVYKEDDQFIWVLTARHVVSTGFLFSRLNIQQTQFFQMGNYYSWEDFLPIYEKMEENNPLALILIRKTKKEVSSLKNQTHSTGELPIYDGIPEKGTKLQLLSYPTQANIAGFFADTLEVKKKLKNEETYGGETYTTAVECTGLTAGGSSGGGVFTGDGKLAGINQATYAGENLAVYTPINGYLQRLLQQFQPEILDFIAGK